MMRFLFEGEHMAKKGEAVTLKSIKSMEIYDKEYSDELVRRFNEGGTIWLIERTDTNQFYDSPVGLSIHTFGSA